jgi:hypothetical protein
MAGGDLPPQSPPLLLPIDEFIKNKEKNNSYAINPSVTQGNKFYVSTGANKVINGGK